ncbi:hypothetical protein M3Y97_00344100 [Aphelenchoides bicaudatus]|nr:hypothetical protein M3Y97_00344100 [Aphelenchoides bicaudatus]
MSNDLKDCLNFCCGIPDCQAVTFMGFLKKDSPNPDSKLCNVPMRTKRMQNSYGSGRNRWGCFSFYKA